MHSLRCADKLLVSDQQWRPIIVVDQQWQKPSALAKIACAVESRIFYSILLNFKCWILPEFTSKPEMFFLLSRNINR